MLFCHFFFFKSKSQAAESFFYSSGAFNRAKEKKMFWSGEKTTGIVSIGLQ